LVHTYIYYLQNMDRIRLLVLLMGNQNI